MILISACLLGRNVKYSGGNNLCPWLAKYYNTEDFTAFCPECLAMLPIPGAQKSLQIAKNKGANYAILKARSPSCGCGEIYDGTFSGGKKRGNGVAAELLMQHGIKVYTEETLTEEELIKILQNK